MRSGEQSMSLWSRFFNTKGPPSVGPCLQMNSALLSSCPTETSPLIFLEKSQVVNPILLTAFAVLAAVRETGVSMMYTSIVLFFGFLMFAMSEFDGTRSLGMLVSVTLLVAMFTNLMLLPSMLMSFAYFVTAKTFREPFFDLLDEEDILALDHLQVQKGTSPGKGEEQHEGLRARD